MKNRGVKGAGQGVFGGFLGCGPTIEAATDAHQQLRFEALAYLKGLLDEGVSPADAETQTFQRFCKESPDNLELSKMLRKFSQHLCKEDNYSQNYLPAF